MLRLLALAFLLVPAASAQGVLTFDRADHDFGVVAEGEPAETVFAFTNTGDRALRITDVRTSCGCTTPRYPTGSVAPGARGEVAVGYDSAGRPGPFERTITVFAEDSQPGATTLRIAGDVLAGFAVGGVAQGSAVWAYTAHDLAEPTAPGAPVEHAFRFQNRGGVPVSVEGGQSDAPGVSVIPPSRRVPGGGIGIVYLVVEDAEGIADADGMWTVEADIVTTDPAQPVHRLRLSGRVAAGG